MNTITGTIYTQNLGICETDAQLLAIANKMVELIERDYPLAYINIAIIENVQGIVDSSINLFEENYDEFDEEIVDDISEYYYQLACESI